MTPIVNAAGQREYQASSPDEIALVKFAESLGVILKDRDTDMVTLEYPGGKEEKFKVLGNFPFSSKTKRMGIIVRQQETQRVFFYLKGAEVKLEKRVFPDYAPIIKESAELLAMDGLRTLVIAQKELTEDEYSNWEQLHKEANMSMDDRDRKVHNTVKMLEKNMYLLGISGVEDKLQEDVAGTVDSLKSAGIRVWMLTGDKIETAKCIAISSGIKSKSENFHVIRDLKDNKEIIEFNLKEAEKKADRCILVIDGGSLDVALRHAEKLFFEVAAKTQGLVCCRCSPTQKTLIVNKMKTLTNKRCASIGDGGNDVGMIQEADCGIGIVGKEGMQASLAADFSVTRRMLTIPRLTSSCTSRDCCCGTEGCPTSVRRR